MKRSHKIIVISSISLILAFITFLTFFKINSTCKGLCTGCNACKNNRTQSITYYINKKDKLIDELQKKQKIFEPSLHLYYSNTELKSIYEETTDIFVTLIPDIPYIGGDDNDLTEDIEQAAMVLAFYQIQLKHGRTSEEVGTIITESITREINKYPKWFTHIIGSKFFNKKYIEQVKYHCEESQEKEYNGNWVTFYVEGDGKTFDYGFNHIECGIVKYLNKYNAKEIIPYLCSVDYIYSDALGEGLVRTSTIANNGQYCDFRFKR